MVLLFFCLLHFDPHFVSPLILCMSFIINRLLTLLHLHWLLQHAVFNIAYAVARCIFALWSVFSTGKSPLAFRFIFLQRQRQRTHTTYTLSLSLSTRVLTNEHERPKNVVNTTHDRHIVKCVHTYERFIV